MLRTVGFGMLLAVVASWNAFALTGNSDSGSGALETISPRLNSVSPVTERSLSATYSEPMLAPGVTTPSNYVVSGPGMGTLAANPNAVSGAGPYTLTWMPDQLMQKGASLDVATSGTQDLAGNPIDSAHNTASCVAIGPEPVFRNIIVTPIWATTGDTVRISFMVSELLDSDAQVMVNGHAAEIVSGSDTTYYVYQHVVTSEEPLGFATVIISGIDPDGYVGSLSDSESLEILDPSAIVPLLTWPLAAILLMAGFLLLVRRRARVGALLILAMLASAAAVAANPTVSNVTFTQSPNGTTGTKVDVYYDLVAPNGPCSIVLSLSKNGGTDGFNHPITSCTGDTANVTTGTGRHIVWNIRADYPEESIPNARIRVTADDGITQYTLTYTAGANGTISGSRTQAVNHGTSGSPVIAVPNTGYLFTRWSDGSTQNPRTDTNVTGNNSVTATFSRGSPTPGEQRTFAGIAFRWCPAGTFMMGSYSGEQDSWDEEDPQHQVTLTTPVWMSETEITQAQWVAVMGSNPSHFTAANGHGDDTTRPVEQVSWNDICTPTTGFLAKMNAANPDDYFSLPSEAVWEYAYRAGTTTRFYWGDDPSYTAIVDYAWCESNSSYSTHPVGQKKANAWGLKDMSGNVSEWCYDHWSWYTSGAVDNPTGPETGLRHVIRGGCYHDSQHGLVTSFNHCRAAYRGDHTVPGWKDTGYGFRICRDYDHHHGEIYRYALTYTAGVNGAILGNSYQTVDYGISGTPVTAVPNEGYAFTQWSDNSIQNPRTDTNIIKNIMVVANFTLIVDPAVTSFFSINDGAAITSSSTVTLNNTCANAPTQYMASESSSFTGATWQPYSTTPQFVLSASLGAKTVYFKVKNMVGESNTLNDNIELVIAPTVSSFTINNGAESSITKTVTMNNSCTESPTQYMASESPSFTGATWRNYSTTPQFTLSAGTGTKTVYFKVKNSVIESAVVSDEIVLRDPTAGEQATFAGIAFRWCPAGTFMMGRYSGEQDSSSDEEPQHQVTLSKGFWMSETEVTQAQWVAVMGNNPSYFTGDTMCPVETVSWNDICKPTTGYLAKLNAANPGKGFRLPTEAEWEYANRAGTTQRFYWGDDPSYTQIGNYAWYDGNSSDTSHPVGQKTANTWGLRDMSGNVLEWCSDLYGSYTSGAVTDPTGRRTGYTRVVRGGFFTRGYDCRAANRVQLIPDDAGRIVGFRVAWTP